MCEIIFLSTILDNFRCRRETQNQKPRQRNQSIMPARSHIRGESHARRVTRVRGYIRSRGCSPLSDCLRGPWAPEVVSRELCDRHYERGSVERSETKGEKRERGKKRAVKQGDRERERERVANVIARKEKKKRAPREFSPLSLRFFSSSCLVASRRVNYLHHHG